MLLVRPPLTSRISPIRARVFVVLAVFAVLFLWHTAYVFPIKIIVVFLHEISHALVALLTGGEVDAITVDVFEGGSCLARGGNRFLIINSGYLGSMFLGATILLLASRTGFDRVLTLALGLALAAVTYLYVTNDFGKEFGYLASAFAVIAALKLPEIVCEATLILVGVTSCLYAVFDIVSDVFYPTETVASDALLLSELTGVPAVFWGTVWLLITVWGTLAVLRLSMFGFKSSAEDEDEDEDGEEEEEAQSGKRRAAR